MDPDAAELELLATRLQRSLQVLKVHHPRGFQPGVRISGREHIDAALARGRGAILWGAPFQCANLIEPIAFQRAGIELHHLSNWNHGLGLRTRVGARLNRIVVAAEERFLAERIVIERGSVAALLILRARLAENRVVGMRAVDYARRVLDLPFLAGRIRLATGAVELALGTGAALLPMFGVCSRRGGGEVHVEDAGTARSYRARSNPPSPGVPSGVRREG
jgi:lauroyl/myristoyl acyltransferase